ncbi:MAG: SufE family protein [Micavibrio sp.]|nr:SufE family protein [Micavibrio sp.]
MSIDELVDNFQAFDDWESRYEYLIDLGKHLPPMDDALKTPSTRVSGCLSEVWMVLSWDKDGRVALLADSDAVLVKGLIAVVSALFVGKTAAEAAKVDVAGEFARLGLDQHISPNRRNGFFSMVQRVKVFTAAPNT